MRKISLISILMIFVCVFNAESAINMKNHTAERYAAQEGIEIEDIDDDTAIATLENDIKILDEEIAKCEKQKKGWIAATVIGGAGTLSTGIAAAVQGVKIKEQKDEIADKKKTIKELTEQSNALDK